MGYRYAIIGAGRQGLSAAYDLARFGSAEEILLCDLKLETAQKGVEKLRAQLSQDLFIPVNLDAGNRIIYPTRPVGSPPNMSWVSASVVAGLTSHLR